MTRAHPSTEQIKKDSNSTDQNVRRRAVQTLRLAVQEDRGIHEMALLIFRAAIENSADSLTATTAASGIEYIAGPVESRTAWLSLLNHPDEQMVVSTTFALSATDDFYSPHLLQLLTLRPEVRIHTAVIHRLGRTKNPMFLTLIVDHLANPKTRASAIEALQELEDPRAIPYLEPLLTDETEAGTDDRGAAISIGDLAGYAVRRLRFVAVQP